VFSFSLFGAIVLVAHTDPALAAKFTSPVPTGKVPRPLRLPTASSLDHGGPQPILLACSLNGAMLLVPPDGLLHPFHDALVRVRSCQ